MNILSINTTKTMTYDVAASVQAFAIVEKLVAFAGSLLNTVHALGATDAALRQAQA